MRFFAKLVLFCLPIGLYLSVPYMTLVYSGELTSVNSMAKSQMNNPNILYGRKFKDNFFVYKLAASRLRKPDILVLGSSRVMQWRSMFFHLAEPTVFYNAGGAAQNIYEMEYFLNQLNDFPKILIIGLDNNWLLYDLPPTIQLNRLQLQVDEEQDPLFARLLNLRADVFAKYKAGGLDLEQVIARHDPVYHLDGRGLNTITGVGGFRYDGSYQYSYRLLGSYTTADRLAEGYQRMQSNTVPFLYGEQVNVGIVAEVDKLLAFCEKHNIFVIGYSTPIAPGIFESMQDSQNFTYLQHLGEQFEPLFDSYGFRFFDFVNPAVAGVTDAEMIDGFHASEAATLKLYLVILQALPDIFVNYSDIDYLRGRLQSSPNSPEEFFKNEF